LSLGKDKLERPSEIRPQGGIKGYISHRGGRKKTLWNKGKGRVRCGVGGGKDWGLSESIRRKTKKRKNSG